MKPHYMITTPIYYVNGAPHVGHAYTSIAADVLARFKRLDGYDVFFLTGTDEHGQKVEQAAQDKGQSAQNFATMVSAQFRNMADQLNVSYDDFIRTTEERHIKSCQALWQKIADAGHIYLGAYEGWYSLRDECYYGEDELTTTQEGKKIAPTGAEVKWLKEPSYFFKLSAWQDKLLEFYEQNPKFIGPESRRNELLSFIKSGLRDLSVSRTSFKWGIPVPGDDDHVMYVWFDALTNYISALGYPNIKSSDLWRFWPADLHLVGKEISRFHALYWPAFLMAAGLEVPKRIYSHGWWTVEGEKMSKSVGNVIEPLKLVEEFGLDPVRFFLLREVPFGGDGDYSRQSLINRMNNELANDLGNLAQRTLSQVMRNCEGKLPEIGQRHQDDETLLSKAILLPTLLREQMDRQALHESLETIWKIIRASNAYIDHQAPWTLKKTDPQRMTVVLRVLVDTLRIIATCLQPFIPGAMDKLLTQLGVSESERQLSDLETVIPAGRELPAPSGIFPRFVEAE
ncbi:methionine--tRNA ligase [Commensalibacter papalotli (ex Botero et al. 2024)]|uniref:Methionine--tRNA ligase n=1 Tax=Commensalibacter papalotli (ex Botero et al. 2024) TaxID=2972766 RepID=A0ABM9HIC7_9PROT|nr:methionine--tRNA ligase [Commensalibacter papalotli (ex Botero et al. 2024)]CAI3922808.1 Methionyl-tRNA synthetase (MetG) (PDB:1A8H) [Commensalibacter papalotli (ex Botero et al. 2024)]CAI3929427.1 Methionyl-tRNA synthetase (MetG) (PDB:1A8H) [Commensalibacter papalotli (ex Botero et al. 2024)]